MHSKKRLFLSRAAAVQLGTKWGVSYYTPPQRVGGALALSAGHLGNPPNALNLHLGLCQLLQHIEEAGIAARDGTAKARPPP
jgi:hypothetical protein